MIYDKKYLLLGNIKKYEEDFSKAIDSILRDPHSEVIDPYQFKRSEEGDVRPEYRFFKEATNIIIVNPEGKEGIGEWTALYILLNKTSRNPVPYEYTVPVDNEYFLYIIADVPCDRKLRSKYFNGNEDFITTIRHGESSSVIKIVTLCGSLKHKDFFDKIAASLEINYGLATFHPYEIKSMYPTVNENHDNKLLFMIKELHFTKIELSDAIFVVAEDDYIGKDTMEEIAYALKSGKAIMTAIEYENTVKKAVKELEYKSETIVGAI